MACMPTYPDYNMNKKAFWPDKTAFRKEPCQSINILEEIKIV
jgi:hypothetical protein